MKKKENLKQLFKLVSYFTVFFLIHEICAVLFGVEVFNYGISFGILSNNYNLILTLISLFLVIIWNLRNKNIYIFLFIIGAIINLIDRFRFGGVRDYWKIPMTALYNNSNDYLIFVAIVIYCKNILWKKK